MKRAVHNHIDLLSTLTNVCTNKESLIFYKYHWCFKRLTVIRYALRTVNRFKTILKSFLFNSVLGIRTIYRRMLIYTFCEKTRTDLWRALFRDRMHAHSIMVLVCFRSLPHMLWNMSYGNLYTSGPFDFAFLSLRLYKGMLFLNIVC